MKSLITLSILVKIHEQLLLLGAYEHRNLSLHRWHGPLLIKLNISKHLACGPVPANFHNLRNVHSRLKLSANTLVAQIVKREVCDASPYAQSIPSLPKRNIHYWKDAVRWT